VVFELFAFENCDCIVFQNHSCHEYQWY